MDRKKRVAIFTENLYGGGVERIQQIILRNFDYEKYDVTLYSNRKEVLSKDFYPTHIKYRYIFDNNSENILSRIWGKIKNKVKLWIYYHCSPKVFHLLFIRKKFDVAIAFIEGYATRFISGMSDSTRKIAWIHIELDTFHWTEVAFRNNLDEINCYKRINNIPCVSQIVKEQADKLFNLKEKTLVLHNPIDRDIIIRQAKERLPKDLSKRHSLYRIITLGTLNERKGHIRLIRTINQLYKEGYNIELWILGDGPEKNKLNEFIKINNLNNNIKLLGFQNNPYPYIAVSDIYVCSSYAEGYNTAITEALVLGKAVVSTECSGVKEQLGENNKYGICVPNTEKGLYEGLKQMLNKSTLKYYTQKAQERGKDFNLEASMNKIYQLIES
ncbi:MAG: glycosyltransferase [Rikenellaceae bacterium]|nr:glycosyltransferase [Rikenellaceae bacterium]